MKTMTIETDMGLWIDGDQIQVFVGDNVGPSASFDLVDLVRLELMSHAIPATSQTVDDIESMSIDGRERIHELHEALHKATNMVFDALTKTR